MTRQTELTEVDVGRATQLFGIPTSDFEYNWNPPLTILWLIYLFILFTSTPFRFEGVGKVFNTLTLLPVYGTATLSRQTDVGNNNKLRNPVISYLL